MSEETEVQEQEVEQEQELETTDQGGGDDIEERARSMGWVPEEDFRGDKSRWVDAEKFVERGENELPILRERMRTMQTQLTDTKKLVKRLAKQNAEISGREYKRMEAQVQEQKAAAVELGDSEAFRKAEDQERELEKLKPEEIKVEESEELHPDFTAWLDENTWYQNDPTAAAVADSIAQQLSKTSNLQGRAFFDEVTKKTKKELPHKFQNSRRGAPSSVEGAGGGRRQSGKKSYTDLPPEAKQACDRFVKQGLMKKEEYVKDFFGEQA